MIVKLPFHYLGTKHINRTMVTVLKCDLIHFVSRDNENHNILSLNPYKCNFHENLKLTKCK